MHEHGLSWCNEQSYLKYTNYNIYQSATCYTSRSSYASLDFYKKNGYEVLDWKDYMYENNIIPKFTKSDLKPGMVVEYRNGERSLFINDIFMSDCNYRRFDDYNNDLLNSFHVLDIHKVYTTKGTNFKTLFLDENLELIWCRDTLILTKENAEKELQEFLGKKVTIKD